MFFCFKLLTMGTIFTKRTSQSQGLDNFIFTGYIHSIYKYRWDAILTRCALDAFSMRSRNVDAHVKREEQLVLMIIGQTAEDEGQQRLRLGDIGFSGKDKILDLQSA